MGVVVTGERVPVFGVRPGLPVVVPGRVVVRGERMFGVGAVPWMPGVVPG